VNAAKVLLARGAEVDPREGRFGATPFGFAVWASQAGMIELLGPRSRDVWNLVFTGHVDRLRELLDAEPALAGSMHPDGETPLMRLPRMKRRPSRSPDSSADHGADVSARNDRGESAAELATDTRYDPRGEPLVMKRAIAIVTLACALSCSARHDAASITGALRAPVDPPENFTTPDPSGAACRSPMTDPRGRHAAALGLVERRAGRVRGSRRAATVSRAGEVLRVDCASGKAVGIAKRRKGLGLSRPPRQLTPVPPIPQYPFGFLCRYCWW
jgi:hypothetical protein